MKWIVLLAFVLIISSLGSALFFLVRDKGNTRSMARALAFRVGFSILLFLGLMFSWWMGWINYTGVPLAISQ
ncbi:MAG: twin transmembrane helix small protein [Burkholderiaceae bacterium]